MMSIRPLPFILVLWTLPALASIQYVTGPPVFSVAPSSPFAELGQNLSQISTAVFSGSQELAEAWQPKSDILPDAMTADFVTGLHRFDPALGNPFVADQWASYGKLTPASMNDYSNQLFNAWDPLRIEPFVRTTTVQIAF